MSKKQPRIAILVENLYQELEVWYPVYRFLEAGAKVTVIGPERTKYQSKLGYPIEADLAAADAKAVDFDAVIVPGGFAPDLMRACKPMVELVRACHDNGALVAAICHGTWIVISAGLAKDRRLTGAPSIADDIRNAGAHYVDAPAVTDRGIVTSRKPADIPAFSEAILQALSEKFDQLGRQ